MKIEQALRIARTLVAQTSDIEIVDIKIKSMEPAGGRITVAVDAVSEEDENDCYEVEIDPTANSVSLKEIKGSYSLDEYLNEPMRMSELNPGQLFKLKYDCVVYEYYRTVRDRENRAIYRFTRKGSCNIAQSVQDIEVFPIG